MALARPRALALALASLLLHTAAYAASTHFSQQLGSNDSAAPLGDRRALVRREGGKLLAARERQAVTQSVTPIVSEDTDFDFRVIAVGVGNSKDPEKCIRATQPVMCPPNAGNLGKRINKDQTAEEFDITVSGGIIVCVRRTDALSGWEMALEIGCVRQASMTITIGSSTEPSKCKEVDQAVTCTTNAANPGIRYTRAGGEDFVFQTVVLPTGNWSRKATRVCVTRKDLGSESRIDFEGWDFELEISCAIIERPFRYSMRTINMGKSPDSNTACYTLASETDLVSCPTNAAEFNHGSLPAFEVVSDFAFHVPPVRGSRICARRVDKIGGWDAELQLSCSGAGEITLGSSLWQLKCITMDQPVVCIPAAADERFRLNRDGGGETFDVTTSGYSVCVRRTDEPSGWNYNLQIACVPNIGWKHAIGSAGMTVSALSSRRRHEPWLKYLDVKRADEVATIFDGDLVWLASGQNRWLGCLDDGGCETNKRQAPSRFRVFMHTNRSRVPLTSGKEVWLREEATSNFLKCDKACRANSKCPSDQSFALCQDERFKFFSAYGELTGGSMSSIRDGDTVWLQHSGNDMMSCSISGDPCKADGVCAMSAPERLVTKDIGCKAERFRIYKAHVAGASKIKEAQAVTIAIGSSKYAQRCVGFLGSVVSCAVNAGDSTYRAQQQSVEDPRYNISVRAGERPGGHSVCALRTDVQKGWDLNLKVTCTRLPSMPLWPHDVPSSTSAPSHIIPVGSHTVRKPRKARPVVTRLGDTEDTAGSDYGSPLCPCVDAGLSGVATISNKEVFFGLHYGARCSAWDDGKAPGCEDEGQTPGIGKGKCARKWCYVDPCNCDVDTAPKPVGDDAYFPGALYKGMRLHVSEATCAAPLAQPPQSRCKDAIDEATCGAVMGCEWHGTRCSFKEFANACLDRGEGEGVPMVNALLAVNGICCGEMSIDAKLQTRLTERVGDVVQSLGIASSDAKAHLNVNCSLTVSVKKGKAALKDVASVMVSRTVLLSSLEDFLRSTRPPPKPPQGCDDSKPTEKMMLGVMNSGNSTLQTLTVSVEVQPHLKMSYGGYDCAASRDNLTGIALWSQARKEWCCQEKQVACETEKTDSCWEPHVECKPAFRLGLGMGKYVGCVTNGENAYCGIRPMPFVNSEERGELRKCKKTACNEVCYQPVGTCLDTFEHKGEIHSGCVRDRAGAWCRTGNRSKDIAFCEQVPCSKTCWVKPDRCVQSFKFNGAEVNNCSNAGELKGPWCSVGGDQWAYCKQVLCDNAAPSAGKASASSTSASKAKSRSANTAELDEAEVLRSDPDGAWRGNPAPGGKRAPASPFRVLAHLAPARSSSLPALGGSAPRGGRSRGRAGEVLAAKGLLDGALAPPTNMGNSSCPCIGYTAIGNMETNIYIHRSTGVIKEDPPDKTDYDPLPYQIPLGGYCSDWHRNVHPFCKGAQATANKWCAEQWCFVDPCNCRVPKAYRKSSLFNGSYQGKRLAYSYVTCGATDQEDENLTAEAAAETPAGTVANSTKNLTERKVPIGARTKDDAIICGSEAASASKVGMYNCRCVGFDAAGDLQTGVADDDRLMIVPGGYGATCKAWEGPNISACYGKTPPKFCAKRNGTEPWCLVDPCDCSLSVDTDGDASFIGPFEIHGRKLHMSKATCQPHNETIWGGPARLCLTLSSMQQCVNGKDCTWVPTDKNATGKTKQVAGYCVDSSRKHCPADALKRMAQLELPREQFGTKKAPCDEKMCSFGSGLKAAAWDGEIACGQTPCSSADIDTCCEPMGSCETFGEEGCGARGVLKPRPEHIWCNSSTCSFADYNQCCDDRDLCSNFSKTWCPVGFRIMKRPQLGTCTGLKCKASKDFERCCVGDTGNVIISLISGMITLTFIAIGLAFVVVIYKRARAEHAIQSASIKRQLRFDTDGTKMRFDVFKRKHGLKTEYEALEAWEKLQIVPDEEANCTFIKAHYKGYKTRLETKPYFMYKRQYEGKSVTFSRYRAIKKGVPIATVREEFLALPQAS